MPHDTAIIATVAAGLGVAFVLGVGAARLRLSPIVGYLLAGVLVGPFTPGYVADAGVAQQLAELGVILLMFGVGLHFSLDDLADARRVAVPGALAQIAITGTVGTSVGRLWGLSWGGAVVLGLSVAVASTVVLLKGLEARDQLDSAEGRIAVGWLVVEDVAMVLALVLLPALAPVLQGAAAGGAPDGRGLAATVAAALGRVAVFVGLMYFVGRRAVPWLLEHVARVGSRELFTLAVLVTALGIGAVAAELFGVSFALGAFFAGAVISESELSQRAAADALPLQDAFAVLFFVSVGMLFQPAVVAQHLWRVLALVGIVVVGKTIAGYAVVRALRQPPRLALLMGASIGQIGEFSFIVTALGVSLGLLPAEEQALVVAAALIAITVNGPVVSAVARIAQRLAERAASPLTAVGHAMTPAGRAVEAAQAVRASGVAPFDFSAWAYHVILVGHGRVGATVAEALMRAGIRYVVVEERARVVAGLRRRGENAIHGDATRADVLDRAGITRARLIVVTAPEPIRARRIIEVARAENPHVAVAVRTHSAAEQAFFEEHLAAAAPVAVGRSVYAEREAALSLAHFALETLGRSPDEAAWVIDALRGAPTRPTESFSALPTNEYAALVHGTTTTTGGGERKRD